MGSDVTCLYALVRLSVSDSYSDFIYTMMDYIMILFWLCYIFQCDWLQYHHEEKGSIVWCADAVISMVNINSIHSEIKGNIWHDLLLIYTQLNKITRSLKTKWQRSILCIIYFIKYLQAGNELDAWNYRQVFTDGTAGSPTLTSSYINTSSFTNILKRRIYIFLAAFICSACWYMDIKSTT